MLWRLAIANWWANLGRTCAVVTSVALGVGTVVVVSNFYETARRGITDEVVTHWLGAAHVTVHPLGAHWGSIDASVATELAELENVRFVSARLRRRASIRIPVEGKDDLQLPPRSVDAVGVDWETERHFKTLPNLRGRMFKPGERGVTVLEDEFAKLYGLSLDDEVVLTPYALGSQMRLKIIGLFDSPRVAAFQQPIVYLPIADLQTLRNEPNTVTSIDLMLEDPSLEAIASAKASALACLTNRGIASICRVETAEARQMVLAEAERITRLILMLAAFVAMLTSFFIILTTQSISLVQRRTQLGIMRCLGMTRGQLAMLLGLELVPLGLIGTGLGIIGGISATHLVAAAMSESVMHVYVSGWGLRLAAISGTATSLLSSAMLAVQIGRVSPLEAVNTQARPVRIGRVYLASAVGVLLVMLHQWMAGTTDQTKWLSMWYAGIGTVSLYLGYALLAPTVVVCLGRPLARGVGRLMGLRGNLVEEPFLRAPWRSTGACWVLMVGLSLIVYIAARTGGIMAIWDFPARLPAGFVWTQNYVSGEVIERVSALPGLDEVTVTTDVGCEIETSGLASTEAGGSILERFLKRLTKPVFVAADPRAILRMLKVAFLEGSQEDALAKLERGGYVLIPSQTCRTHNLHLGDRITVRIRKRSAEFEIAGVIQSPALDLAVTAFQAESYMQIAAASAILGTQADLRDKFGLDIGSMFMCEFDLAPSAAPAGFSRESLPANPTDRQVAELTSGWLNHLPEEKETKERLAAELESWRLAPDAAPPTVPARFSRAIRWAAISSQTKGKSNEDCWLSFRQRLLLLRMAEVMERPEAIVGSLSHLRQQLQVSLQRAIRVIVWLPGVILIVATLGIANLMMVSVHTRTRSIAILRAVGALKSQIVRMVVAEAITIGLLGSVLGVALGLHEAYTVNMITAGLIDVTLKFVIPFETIVEGVILTVSVCILASVIPARHAARNNIVGAMQAT